MINLIRKEVLFIEYGILVKTISGKEIKEDYSKTLEQCEQMQPYDKGKYAFRWLLDGILRIFAPLC